MPCRCVSAERAAAPERSRLISVERFAQSASRIGAIARAIGAADRVHERRYATASCAALNACARAAGVWLLSSFREWS